MNGGGLVSFPELHTYTCSHTLFHTLALVFLCSEGEPVISHYPCLEFGYAALMAHVTNVSRQLVLTVGSVMDDERIRWSFGNIVGWEIIFKVLGIWIQRMPLQPIFKTPDLCWPSGCVFVFSPYRLILCCVPSHLSLIPPSFLFSRRLTFFP